MQISTSTPRKPVTIQGVTVQLPAPFSPEVFNPEGINGLGSSENLASVLNQTLAENIRNNTAQAVLKKVLEVAKTLGIKASKVSDLTDEEAEAVSAAIEVAPIQTLVDEYVAEYQFGVRQVSAGEALSPVEREAMRLAVTAVRDAIERKWSVGGPRSDSYKKFDEKVQADTEKTGNQMTAAEWIRAKAEDHLKDNDTLRKAAEQIVAQRNAVKEAPEIEL